VKPAPPIPESTRIIRLVPWDSDALVEWVVTLILGCCMTVLILANSMQKTQAKQPRDRVLTGSIEFEFSGAIHLSRTLELSICHAQTAPMPLFSLVAVPDKIFRQARIQLPDYQGAREYRFNNKNWPLLSGRFPADLINFEFQDGSIMLTSSDTAVKFVVNTPDARSGVVTFRGYRVLRLLPSQQFEQQGRVQGKIRWQCQ
jgi:hypothetical protein